jgi:exopolysaccharide biosynthesis WecB/TagA/CpsF family protein
MSWPGRVGDVLTVIPDVHCIDLRAFLERLSKVSVRGLAHMYEPRSRSFPQTVRASGSGLPPVPAGRSVRYTAIAALGLSRLDEPTRREVLAGDDVLDLIPGILGLALAGRDPGALALAVWAAIEVAPARGAGVPERERVCRALDRLLTNVRTDSALPTVDHAWTLVALLEAARRPALAEAVGGPDQLAQAAAWAAERLLTAQGPTGLFPHHLPADRLSGLRSHVGCFADQVYPIQALSRYAAATGDARALAAAGRCADRIVALQGPQGQWWWHYDWRHGTVIEGYPVYSVHQHAMAPMALLELREAGGPDHRAAVAAGLGWLLERPESATDLIADELGVVWRKVGRREPRKVVRRLRSAASAAQPELRLGWLEVVFPPGPVDLECRPYELGWMLYAWHAQRQDGHRDDHGNQRRNEPPAHEDTRVLSLPTARRERRSESADPTTRIFGLTLDALTLDQAVARCMDALERRERLLVGVVNAAKVVAAERDVQLRESLLSCDVLLADGQSVVWASRFVGDRPLPERVTGIDLFERLLDLGQEHGYSVYLLGARPAVLTALQARLRDRWPRLAVAGARDGYFTPQEAPQVAAEIKASGADMLFLGMTSPKKEIFLRDYGLGLGVPVMHGVGGSFDVLAGVTKRAPLVWQRAGMEWAYRLVQEPRRLWRRYLRTNTAFVTRTVRERFRPMAPYPVPVAEDVVIDLRGRTQPLSPSDTAAGALGGSTRA